MEQIEEAGGGGSGGFYLKSFNNVVFYSGTGAKGTSYSGGTGGGGAYGNTGRELGRPWYVNAPGNPGSDNGGNGGAGGSNCGQGAGNPGGANGTGGTLILYAKNFNNKGTISSNGSQGGQAKNTFAYASGGGSGRWQHKYFL